LGSSKFAIREVTGGYSGGNMTSSMSGSYDSQISGLQSFSQINAMMSGTELEQDTSFDFALNVEIQATSINQAHVENMIDTVSQENKRSLFYELYRKNI